MGMGPLARLDCWCQATKKVAALWNDPHDAVNFGTFLNVAPESSKSSKSQKGVPIASTSIFQEELRRVMMALDPSLSHSDLEIIFSGADLSKVSRVPLGDGHGWFVN